MAEMELRPDSHGKVRDIYDCGDSLLMVASDRISAYDFILPDEIPHKGEILTRISAFWFERFADLIPNHMISCDVADLPEEYAPYAEFTGTVVAHDVDADPGRGLMRNQQAAAWSACANG